MSGLSNADFRNIVAATPMRGAPSSGDGSGETERPKKKARSGGYRPKPKKDEDDEERAKSNFRDRAKERREGKLPEDFADINVEKLKELTEEETKYLGGDMEHTHLVKGLDFALLAKVRTEVTHQRAQLETLQSQQHGAAVEGATTTFATQDPGTAVFAKTSLGKAVLKSIAVDRKISMVGAFAEGRTCLVYDTGEAGADAMPTTLINSQGTVEPMDARMICSFKESLIAEVGDIVKWVKSGRKGGARQKRQPSTNTTSTSSSAMLPPPSKLGPVIPVAARSAGAGGVGAGGESDLGPMQGSAMPSMAGPALGPMAGPALGPMAGPALGPMAGPALGPMAGPALGPMAGPSLPSMYDDGDDDDIFGGVGNTYVPSLPEPPSEEEIAAMQAEKAREAAAAKRKEELDKQIAALPKSRNDFQSDQEFVAYVDMACMRGDLEGEHGGISLADFGTKDEVKKKGARAKAKDSVTKANRDHAKIMAEVQKIDDKKKGIVRAPAKEDDDLSD